MPPSSHNLVIFLKHSYFSMHSSANNNNNAKNKMKCKNNKNKQKKAAVVVTTKITAAVSIATNNISHTNGVT